MGEHQTSIWLGAGDVAAAADAAAGWGGDRITMLNGPDDAWAIAWQTVWDTDDDAAEFEVTAQGAVDKAGGPGQVLPGEGGTTRWVVIGSDDAALAEGRERPGARRLATRRRAGPGRPTSTRAPRSRGARASGRA